ncbi:hypothetical protein CRE_11393 [Caenorhabditis remanei]|uniref:Uncharacterized protein n=1 Tax=Caenorhabditis remanei TaxID=31234 RepID=E3N726_CAERE|nr:hypothetical protein CRE_11393 [Caenorhabditis remanei]
MRSLLPVFILFLSFYSIANARRINVIVKKTNGWHDSATIQSIDYEKLGRKSWEELTEVERYLLETEHALRGLNLDSVSEEYDYQEGEYDEISHDSKEKDNEEATDSEDNCIEDSGKDDTPEDDEVNSVSDEAIEEGEGIDDDNNVNDVDDSRNENQSKEEDDESEDSEEDSAEDSEEDESTETDESLPEEDASQKPSETSHHYNDRRRIGGRAARVWNTRQYQYYHLSVHYLINVYVKLRSKIDI